MSASPAPRLTPPRFTATVRDDGTVPVPADHARPGDEVEVTVRPKSARKPPRRSPDITGSLTNYDDPFGPAGDPDDWNAA